MANPPQPHELGGNAVQYDVALYDVATYDASTIPHDDLDQLT